jgi:hypothetical protein
MIRLSAILGCLQRLAVAVLNLLLIAMGICCYVASASRIAALDRVDLLEREKKWLIADKEALTKSQPAPTSWPTARSLFGPQESRGSLENTKSLKKN